MSDGVNPPIGVSRLMRMRWLIAQDIGELVEGGQRIEDDLYEANPQADEPLDYVNCPRYLTVTSDEDGSHYAALYETEEEALEGLADEVLGERAWWPQALYDLNAKPGDELQIPLTVSVKVSRSNDPGAIVAPETKGRV